MSSVLINFPPLKHGVYSGVGRYGLALAAELISRNAHTYTLRADFPRADLPSNFDNLKFEFIEVGRSSRAIVSILRGWVRDLFKIDGSYDVALNLDPLGSIFAGRSRITVVHDLYFKVMPKLIGSREKFISNIVFSFVFIASRELIAISDTTLSDLKRFFPYARSKANRIYSDATMSPAKQGAAGGGLGAIEFPFVLVVANNTPNKNLLVVADALEALAHAFPGLGVVHVGADEAEVFQTRFRGSESVKVIRLSGLSDADVEQLYRTAKCLCVPSLYEGFCLPIVEAQNFGCPVVFSNRSAAAEIGGEGGLAFDPADVGSLTDALGAVLSSEDVRERLAERGHINAKRFSWKRSAVEFEDMLTSIASAKRSSTRGRDK